MINTMKLETFAPAVIVTEKQTVACPYCPGGYVEVTAMKSGSSMEIPGFKDPQKCKVCSRFFKLVPRVQIFGEPIEGE